MDGSISQALLKVVDAQKRPLSAIAPGYSPLPSLERLVDGVPHPVLVKDRAHRWLLMNEAWCALMGRPREEMLGRTDHDLVSAEQADRYTALDDEVFATGEERQVEESLTLPNGSVHILQTRKRLVRLTGVGGIESFIIVSTADITDVKRAEAALRESEMRFRAMADDAPVMIWASDETGACTFANRLWHETTGQTEIECQGFGWIEAVHPDDRAAVEQAFTAANARHECFRTEYRLRRAEGGYAWVIDTANPRFAPDGTFLGYIGSVLDISERRAMELALRESEDHYRHAVELNPQFPFTTDPNGMLLEISPRFREFFGLTHEETIGTGWMRLIHPDDMAETQRNWTHALTTGTRTDHEKRLRLPDGSYRSFAAAPPHGGTRRVGLSAGTAPPRTFMTAGRPKRHCGPARPSAAAFSRPIRNA
jgi:PAS domain S-box-containing protein